MVHSLTSLTRQFTETKYALHELWIQLSFISLVNLMGKIIYKIT